MADITMCEGQLCPLKDTCYRHTAPVNEYRQSYFIDPPFVHVMEKNKETELEESVGVECEHFWDNKQWETTEK